MRNYYILFQEECSINDAYFNGIILSIQRELFEQGVWMFVWGGEEWLLGVSGLQ